MPEEVIIPEARALKQQLVEGDFQTLIDMILESIGGSLRKLLRRSKSFAPWLPAFAIAILITLIGLIISGLSGGVSQSGYRTLALGGGLIFLFLIIPYNIDQRTYKTLQEHLLDELESKAGLANLHSWFTARASWKWPLLLGSLYIPLNILYGTFFLKGLNLPIEIVVMGVPILFIAGMMLYYLLLNVVLPGRLGRCHFKLNAFDPVSAEVVTHLSGLFNYIAYMIAFLLAAVAIFAVTLVTFHASNLILIIPIWLVLIVIFITSQMSLTRLIKRSKRDSLNQIETQMGILKRKGDLSDKETLDTLFRLWDYHDRVKGTRNSVLSLNGIMNFTNTLLIPLLGYLFANLNNILKLLGWVE